jgi:hypothetical protein
VRIKYSPSFWRSQKQKSMTHEFMKIQKYSLAQSWSKCMTSFSYGPVFDLATWHDASGPLSSIPRSTKAYIDGRMKERHKSKAFGEEYMYTLSDWVYHLRNYIYLIKLLKPPKW